ncbi:MAG: hypothetical protein H8K03_02515 [Nitrospira sp.]
MVDRPTFSKSIASLNLSHADRAIALLWYYRQTQEFEERTAFDLANDLHDEDFPKPNVTRLHDDLTRSRLTIKGRRSGSFQIDLRRLSELEQIYGPFLKIKKVKVQDLVVPDEWVKGTRVYLERLTHQINVANRMLKGQQQLPPLPPGYKDWAYVIMAFARPLKTEITALRRKLNKISKLVS